MSDQITLRDQIAMSAPIDSLDIKRPEPYIAWTIEEKMEYDLRLRYRYSDIAMRVRAETMPKVERKHPEWAKWAARDKCGRCWYYDIEPKMDEDGWDFSDGNTRILQVSGDDSWIPANWRESKVKL